METTLNNATVDVIYDYDGGYKGDYYQPPEPESVYISSVMYKGVDIIDCISDKDMEDLEDACIQDTRENYISYLEDKADQEYEDRRLNQ